MDLRVRLPCMEGVSQMKRYLPFLRQAFLYGVIGAYSSGLDAALFALLCGPLAWNPYIANVLTVHCGMLCSFLCNRRFNFKTTDRTLVRMLMFYATGLFGLLLSQLILWAGSQVCDSIMAVKIASIFVVAAVQFLLNRTFAFGNPRHKT